MIILRHAHTCWWLIFLMLFTRAHGGVVVSCGIVVGLATQNVMGSIPGHSAFR